MTKDEILSLLKISIINCEIQITVLEAEIWKHDAAGDICTNGMKNCVKELYGHKEKLAALLAGKETR